MHLHIGFLEFLVFALYYVLLKLIMHVINVETRRNGYQIPAGVSGLLS